MLSMNDVVALALENNLDIAIARYNLNIADTDILRTAAGAVILGVNSGVLQGTPGGGVGGLSGTVGSGAGGTTVAAGGAATGTAGIVSSTLGLGSAISSFDPILGGTLQLDRATTLSTNALLGRTTVRGDTDTADFNYAQDSIGARTWRWFSTTRRIVIDQPTVTLSPQLNSNFKFTLTQHLPQGFGFLPNTRFIRIANKDRLVADTAFRLQVITTVDQIENIYRDLFFAYENVKVQQDALAFAQKTLSDTQRQSAPAPVRLCNLPAPKAPWPTISRRSSWRRPISSFSNCS